MALLIHLNLPLLRLHSHTKTTPSFSASSSSSVAASRSSHSASARTWTSSFNNNMPAKILIPKAAVAASISASTVTATEADDPTKVEDAESSSTTNSSISSGTSIKLPEQWRELQGLDHWKGLLEPLDLELRKNILFYGDFNQAAYDAYDSISTIGKHEFFERVGMVKGKEANKLYEVVEYLYATADVPEILKGTEWIGYVAVSTDEASKNLRGRRDIVIVWRGIKTHAEKLDALRFLPADIDSLILPSPIPPPDIRGAKVEKGWLDIYTSSNPNSSLATDSARDQVLDVLNSLLEKYKGEEVSITLAGHSLGAALSILCAFDIGVNGINVRDDGGSRETIPVTAFVHGVPGVGNAEFKKLFDGLDGIRALRGRNDTDWIVSYPLWAYIEGNVGEELFFSLKDSPYLKPLDGVELLWAAHDLEANYLHMLGGALQADRGSSSTRAFVPQSIRDVALVNKSTDRLAESFGIPGSWWNQGQPSLIQREDGIWH